MHFLLLLISFVIFYAFGFLLASKFRLRVPQGKGLEVGLASFIGIMILGFSIGFFFNSIREVVYAVSFGLASGFSHRIGFVKRQGE